VTTEVREAPAVAAALQRTREATLQLLEPLDDELLVAQVSPIMSPLVWDLAHIGWFEELWLVRRGTEREPSPAGFDDLYDAFRHERAERSSLPILQPPEARAYLESVRRQALSVLEDEPRSPHVYGLVVQHELQHQETMLQTLQLSGVAYPTPPHDDLRPPPRPEDVLVPAGPFIIGTNDRSWAYDNERPARVVELPAFRIERQPVTNERFTEFVEDGGYRKRRHWSDEGWRWLRAERVEAPLYWERAGEGWLRRRFGCREALPPAEPVQHISFYEAEAVASWAGKRLPTETEWEKAAQGARPGADRASLGPRPVAPRGTSSVGCDRMLGDVWEWTSSAFTGYPGFEAFPYAEYSEVFFGDEHRVLRGGSWATDPLIARVTFRNWDLPQRRQLFSGVRPATDA
jgi:gamma-glutamyl hercynylcysteine S-oxide synthase